MRLVRNPEACCKNCPYWLKSDPEQKNEKGNPVGQCREGQPKPVVITRAVTDLKAAGQSLVQQVDYSIFTPPEDFWCGQHPLVLLQIPETTQ